MSDPKQTLTAEQVDQAALSGWQLDGDQIRATFASGDFLTGVRLVNAVALLAEEANHHPDVLLTYPEVSITLSSHDVGGVTSRDLDLARTINETAKADGIDLAD